MYSHKQTSPIRIKSGTSRFMARGSLLHDAVVCPCPGGDFVFLLRKPEENHRRDAQRMNLASFLHRLIDGEIEHARHRANFLADTFPGANEHGINESFGTKAGLAHQVTELLGSAKPAKTGDRKSHKAPEF